MTTTFSLVMLYNDLVYGNSNLSLYLDQDKVSSCLRACSEDVVKAEKKEGQPFNGADRFHRFLEGGHT